MKHSLHFVWVRFLALMLSILLLFCCLPVAAADTTVDLSQGVVIDNLKVNRSSTQSYICHGAAWVDAYSLFEKIVVNN